MISECPVLIVFSSLYKIKSKDMGVKKDGSRREEKTCRKKEWQIFVKYVLPIWKT